MQAPSQIVQIAPWPDELIDLIGNFRYKPGWTFRFVPDLSRDFEPDDHKHEREAIGRGATLIIKSLTYNSYGEYKATDAPDYRVNHFKIVPPATFNREAWKRWILDMCIEVEIHEACEFARFEGEEVERPFSPLHGPGENPYVIHTFSTDEQRRTSFRGTMNS